MGGRSIPVMPCCLSTRKIRFLNGDDDSNTCTILPGTKEGGGEWEGLERVGWAGRKERAVHTFAAVLPGGEDAAAQGLQVGRLLQRQRGGGVPPALQGPTRVSHRTKAHVHIGTNTEGPRSITAPSGP